MISYLQGKVIIKREKFAVLDVQGVGYKVFLSRHNASKIPEIGVNLKVFCYLVVRENSLDLYGFLEQGQLDFFETLNSISGIGPKAALEISELGPLEKIKDKILAGDDKLFDGIPGIGRKKAMAIILELSGKIKSFEKKSGQESDEAEEVLVSLGFSRQEAKRALKEVPKTAEGTDKRVKEALKLLAK